MTKNEPVQQSTQAQQPRQKKEKVKIKKRAPSGNFKIDDKSFDTYDLAGLPCVILREPQHKGGGTGGGQQKDALCALTLFSVAPEMYRVALVNDALEDIIHNKQLIDLGGAGSGLLFLLDEVTDTTGNHDNDDPTLIDFCDTAPVQAVGTTAPCVRPVKPSGGQYPLSLASAKSDKEQLNTLISSLFVVRWNWYNGIQKSELRKEIEDTGVLGTGPNMLLVATVAPDRTVVWLPLRQGIKQLLHISELFTAYSCTYLDGPNIWIGSLTE